MIAKKIHAMTTEEIQRGLDLQIWGSEARKIAETRSAYRCGERRASIRASRENRWGWGDQYSDSRGY